ncbi:DAK2 domain-containing protein [Corynebacterium sp. MSK204]|uniref:DAK2 domain-containing protein n=1 Tax=Corynebacterium sp. MSK204 TaxID=3050217 RepID=UPI00254AC719|nr:DAK2 domain-containing protein [Corynebacterium sp. MSK204]MDK8658550.1 DAK2 domain-containing protein [Corynebacterium sp. MSK204]
MSYPSTLDARGLRNWAHRAVGELSHRRAEINALNVFPVPDSDTGSNMAHTMEAAVAEVEKGDGDVAAALAMGAVRGARGNSGMVLSQVLRGVAEATVDSTIDGAIFAASLLHAVDLVDRAIAEPVEGTVITVLRCAAETAESTARQPDSSFHGVVAETISAARTALAETPSQLPELRAAGVVDAGGAGLVILLETLLAEIEGTTSHAPESMPETVTELEVVFFFKGDSAVLKEKIAPLGTSLVIAQAGDDSASIHIHSTQAGAVIETAFAEGWVSNLRLEALPETSAPREATGAGQTRTVYAAVPAGPMAELVQSAGVTVVEPGETIHAAGEDIVLSSGLEEHTTAAHTVDISSLAAGLAAISVYEPDNADTAAVVESMRDAAQSMRVAHPAEESEEAIAKMCRQLLAAGGEQVTVISPLTISQEELAAELGVDVVALQVPDIPTEIGVE